MVQRHAVRMQLKPGAAAEYEHRHNPVWPDLSALLARSGISNYTIYLDPTDGALFSAMDIARDHDPEALRRDPLMRQWWAHMAPLMETRPDFEPVAMPLQRVFHLR